MLEAGKFHLLLARSLAPDGDAGSHRYLLLARQSQRVAEVTSVVPKGLTASISVIVEGATCYLRANILKTPGFKLDAVYLPITHQLMLSVLD